MSSFQVSVLSPTVRFFSLLPASLPQLFHRCLPSAFASGIFHFRLAFFRPLVFRFQLLSLCSSFPSLPGSASQLLPQCPSPLSLPRFPLSLQPNFSCFPSRFLYLASLFVSFHSSLLRSHSRSTGAYLPFSLPVFSTSDSLSFVRLSFVSSYSAFCSSFPSLPGSALQLLSRCPSPLSLPRSPLSLQPDFSCFPSRFLYSALLLVSFRPSLIRSRSCSSSAYLVLSLSVFSLSFCFLSSAFCSGSGYLASVSSFPLSSRFPPHSGSSFGASLPLSLLWFSSFSPA